MSKDVCGGGEPRRRIAGECPCGVSPERGLSERERPLPRAVSAYASLWSLARRHATKSSRHADQPMRYGLNLGSYVALVVLLVLSLGGCATAQVESSDAGSAGSSYTTLADDFHRTDLGCGWEPRSSMELSFAKCFTVDYFDAGYALVCVADGNRYLVVPEGAAPPEGLSSDVQVLYQPLGDVYLAASDSMCLFDALGAVDRITVSGIERDDWFVPAARDAMDAGAIVYGGKYRSPDYELLLARGVRLAIESTMINHTPDVREKLQEMGIPVLVELSSYESEPLGRAEWIRLYGLLCGKDEQASQVFDQQVERVGAIDVPATQKTVAFFYLNANGAAVVRRPGDYVTKMIELAGGTYAFGDLESAQAGSSSLTMEMEQFFTMAKDADVMVYNGTIDDSVTTLDELLGKNELLAECKAVQTGEVWVCDQNMYQQMISCGDIIADLNRVLTGSGGTTTYLRRLA